MSTEKPDILQMATKRDNPDFEQVSGYVHKDLALKFRILCTAERRTHSDALAEAINLLLDARAGGDVTQPPETQKPPATKSKRGSS